jgi:hypothetical protein
VGEGSAAASIGAGEDVAEAATKPVGVGLGASVGNSTEVGVSVTNTIAGTKVPQATNRSVHRHKMVKPFMMHGLIDSIYDNWDSINLVMGYSDPLYDRFFLCGVTLP